MLLYQTYTDAQLLSLLAKDDRMAFTALYERHWSRLYQTAFYLLQDQQACLDILQDIFVWIWEKRQELNIGAVPSYLRAAVKFKVANHIRAGRIRDSFFEELEKYRPPHRVLTAEELAEAAELKQLIHQAIAGLPEKCQEIFRLSRDEQLSNQQIADRLGLSVKTVENQMTIALRRLRQAVTPYLIISVLMLNG